MARPLYLVLWSVALLHVITAEGCGCSNEVRNQFTDILMDYNKRLNAILMNVSNVLAENEGNNNLHQLTKQPCELRVDLEDFNNTTKYAKYGEFEVGDGTVNYKLRIAGYTGNAGSSMIGHNGFQFSTKDKDNDIYEEIVPRNLTVRGGIPNATRLISMVNT